MAEEFANLKVDDVTPANPPVQSFQFNFAAAAPPVVAPTSKANKPNAVPTSIPDEESDDESYHGEAPHEVFLAHLPPELKQRVGDVTAIQVSTRSVNLK